MKTIEMLDNFGEKLCFLPQQSGNRGIRALLVLIKPDSAKLSLIKLSWPLFSTFSVMNTLEMVENLNQSLSTSF